MYGIGTVARLAQVSVRTLPYYDDLGLLKPADTDAAGRRHRFLRSFRR
jgi:DNA-binding transcriptional MerR regulator